MTQEEIQLYTDIVKSGFPVLGTLFGSVIGAASTYFLTKLNNKNNNKQETQRARNELLMKTANNVADFEHLMTTYTTTLIALSRKKVCINEWSVAERNLNNGYKSLRKAKMALNILGMKKSLALLESYLSFTEEILVFGMEISSESGDELAQKMSNELASFYQSLSIE